MNVRECMDIVKRHVDQVYYVGRGDTRNPWVHRTCSIGVHEALVCLIPRSGIIRWVVKESWDIEGAVELIHSVSSVKWLDRLSASIILPDDRTTTKVVTEMYALVNALSPYVEEYLEKGYVEDPDGQ